MSPELRASDRLAPEDFRRLRREATLHGFKWDAQVGDACTLAPYALLTTPACWRELASLAERLAAEALQAEAEIIARPELQALLGLPRAVRSALEPASRGLATPAAARILRFDFHPTADGWRISEVNADVPGGFFEGSVVTTLMAEHHGARACPVLPGPAWADALSRATPGGTAALLCASAHLEDAQVVAYLASLLRQRGLRAILASPQSLRWLDGRAHRAATPLDLLVRFFQAEWLPRLPRRCGWRRFFAEGRTPVANPGTAICLESKRFPLAWRLLRAPLPTWRRLLPESVDAREAPWERDESWVLKGALANNGDQVFVPATLPHAARRKLRLDAALFPRAWVAQRRFETTPVDTPDGAVRPCVGVFVIDGLAAGAYVRVSAGPVIDFAATDVPLLIAGEAGGSRS